MKYLLIATSLSAVVQAAYPPGFDSNICTPPTDNGGRDFPRAAPTFRVDVEWNDLVQKRSLAIRQYVSEDLNVGVVYVTGFYAPGVTIKTITSALTGEFFYISDTSASASCHASKLPATQEFVFPVKEDGEGRYKIDADAIWKFGATSVGPMEYNGTQMMNGVLTDVWRGCLYIPAGQVTIAAKYHFSASSWKTASGDQSVPVRVFLSGKSHSETSFKIEQVFNFIHYASNLPVNEPNFMTEIFQTPEHSYCDGQKAATKLPTVPSQFKFELEVLDSQTQTITYVKEFFDTSSNLARIDHDVGDHNTSKIVTEISDFNTGHTYHIDRDNKRCDVTTIANGLFSMPAGNGAVRIRTPEEFFLFDKQDKYPYQYKGMHEVRGIPTNSWISYRPYPTEDSYLMATYQWYYSTRATRIKTDGVVEILEPVQLIINSSATNQLATYSIIKFNKSPLAADEFDISHCFEKADRRTFRMKLAGNHTGVDLEDNVDRFIYWVRLSVGAYSQISSIRIQNVQVEFSGATVDVSFTLLGVPKIVGNAVRPVVPMSLEEAARKITETVVSNTFIVYYMTPDSSSLITLTAIESSFTVKI